MIFDITCIYNIVKYTEPFHCVKYFAEKVMRKDWFVIRYDFITNECLRRFMNLVKQQINKIYLTKLMNLNCSSCFILKHKKPTLSLSHSILDNLELFVFMLKFSLFFQTIL